MIQVLLKALGSIVAKLFATLATKTLLEWMLFKMLEAYVESTKTPHDNDWLKKFKQEYYKLDK